MDLDKLLEGWKLGRLKYPQLRRESEDAFFAALVTSIKELQEVNVRALDSLRAKTAAVAAEMKLAEHQRKEEEARAENDRMAKARAAKAEKREAALAAADLVRSLNDP